MHSSGIKLIDMLGTTIREESDMAIGGDNSHLIYLDGIAEGVYMIILQKGEDIYKSKIVVQ